MRMGYLLLISAFILIISGCEKFLEEVPTGTLSDAATYNTIGDVNALTTGPYRSLNNWTSSAQDWGNNLAGTMEYQSGKATAETPHVQLWRYQTNAINGNMLGNFNNPWLYWFRGVQDANFSIQMLNRVDGVSQAVITSSLGEVHALRAWYYFCLVRKYGDVPYLTEPVVDPDLAQSPRESLKKIYDEIIVPDLLFALNESNLPSGQSRGRVTKDVVRAILADVYLTMAGYPYQEVNTNPTKDWCVDGGWTMSEYPVNTTSARDLLQAAKTQLDALYGTYTLGTYDDLRNPGMNNRGEMIFQAQYLAGTASNAAVWISLPLMSGVAVAASENGTLVPTMGYVNSYGPDDKRMQERQMFFTWDYMARDGDPTETRVVQFGRPYVFKYFDEEAVKRTSSSSLGWTFYRYADILLMLTEVNWALRQSGATVTDNDIVKGINAVRARAELPALAAADVDLHAIMSERAWELVMENKMMWDQRRTRHCLVDGSGEFSAIESFFGHMPTEFNFAFTAMNLLSPIAGNEIARNANMIQNFGHLPIQEQ